LYWLKEKPKKKERRKKPVQGTAKRGIYVKERKRQREKKSGHSRREDRERRISGREGGGSIWTQVKMGGGVLRNGKIH